MKAFIKLLFVVGVAVSCQGSSVLSRISLGRVRRDLSGDECTGQQHGALIPYPGDCTKYLVCEWNSGTVMNCPSGLHFNPVAKVCDWPTSAGCTQGSTAGPSSTPAPTTVPTTLSTPSTIPSTTSPSTVPSTEPSTEPSTTTTPTTPRPSTVPSTLPSTAASTTMSTDEPAPTLEPGDEVCLGKEDGALSPYPYNCSWYIRCEDDKPLVLPCEAGWLFNSILLICDYPENVDCVASPYPTTPTTPLPSTIASTLPSTAASTTMSTDEPAPTLEPGDEVCLGKEDGTLSPYPYNCSWYIRCEDDKPLVLPCEAGWLFNSILLICDYPENVDCVASPYPTTPTTPLPSTIPSTLPSTAASTTMSTDEPAPTLEPGDEVCLGKEDGTLSPYPYNCSWYIRCEDDKPLVLPCEAGWLFNSILLICDYPENVDCVASPYPTTPTTPLPSTIPSTLPSTAASTTMSTDEPAPTLEPGDEVCLGKEDGTLSPYPFNCSWYIRCEDDKPLVLPCEAGWLFNSILLICDYPENVDCVASPYPTTPTTPVPSTLPTTTPSTLPSTTPSTVPSTIPTTPSEPISTTTEDVPTLPSSADYICLNEVNGAVLPYPWDCAWYVRCVDEKPELLPCDDGLVYNSILRICDFPANVECVTTPYPTTSPPPTTSMNTTLDWSSTTNDFSTVETSTRPPYVGTGVCANQELGTLLPYPNRCSLYIVCEETAPIAYSCDEGLEFNAKLKICQEPQIAGCSIITTPSTTTEPPTTALPDVPTGICGGHMIGDLIPYPGICSEYILCKLPIPIAQACPDGQDFNADLKLCQSEEEAGCTVISSSAATEHTTVVSTLPTQDTPSTITSTTTSTDEPAPTLEPGDEVCLGKEDGTLSPYPYNCSWYIRCEDDKPLVLPCEAGWLFNSILLICDYPENVDCVASPYPTTPTTPLPSTIPSTLPSTAASTSMSTDEPAPTLEPGDEVCLGKEDGTLSPYPYNCSWYIRCEDDKPLVLPCEAGWLFNSILLICDYPENVDCVASPYPTTPTTPLPSTIASTLPSTAASTTMSTDEPAPTLEPGDEVCLGKEDGTLSPYPYNCSWYIRCEDDKPLVLPCEAGWLFNSILLICDYPENVDCVASPYPTTPTTPLPSTIPSTLPSTAASTSMSTDEPAPTLEPGDEVCLGKEDGTLSPYPYNCSWYIRCEDDKPLVLPCEAGWLFNSILLICDYPENVDCVASPYPTTPTTPLPSTIASTLPSTAASTTMSTDEPAPTLEPGDEVCLGKEDGTLSPYPYNCSWYIRCEDDKPLVLPCEAGWLFNSILLICDYPENVDCVASPYPTTPTTPVPSTLPSTLPTTTPSTLPPPTPSTVPSTIPTTPSEPISTTTEDVPTLPSSADYICLNEVNGAVLPYPWDCAWYVRCVDEKPELLPCDDGLVYNSILRICDFPANVECVTTPYPTTSPPPTTSMNTTLDWSSTTNDFSTVETSTRPPYVGTGVCANQELGTLLPYPNRCSLYIVCEETAPIAYSCDEGLEFNAKLKICQEPQIAGCSIITTPSTTTEPPTTALPDVPTGICGGHMIGDLIPYPGICSEYILCKLPIPTAQACPEDLEFNADLQLCEAAEDAGCSNTTTTVAPTTTPAPPPNPGFTGICRGQQEGDLIPYPGDCNKYIICENPIPISQKCGGGQEFNADLGICDDPDEGGCSTGNNSTTEATPTTTPSPGTPGMTGICKGYQPGDLIPYPNKCNKYIRCEVPVPIAQTCKAGLQFNEALGICDSSESAGCSGSTTTESPSGSTTPGSTTTPKPPVMTGICSGQEIGDKIAYPKNCSKYIVCDIPVPIAIACADGLHFNADLQICEEPSAAGCEITPPANNTSNVCCGQPIGTLVPYPDDCTQYIECDYPIPQAHPCCTGLHFNAVTKRCESVESAACEWQTTTVAAIAKVQLTCQTAPNGAVFPIPGNCRSFFYCEDGASVPLPCPVNTVFSAEDSKCIAGTACPT